MHAVYLYTYSSPPPQELGAGSLSSRCLRLQPHDKLMVKRLAEQLLWAQALSPAGRCKTFEATADGYGRGESFVTAMLQPADSSDGVLGFIQVILPGPHQGQPHECHQTCTSDV